ncbi:MAG: hypothetical protein E2O59_09280 [Gammaproteobacteria bacterium]|nr:MAG: hypothetical protein E2O59_09280 [Gammaproteobacteria bacterium]
MAESQTRGRRQLMLLFGVAVMSLVGAWGLFVVVSNGGVWGTTNQGQFVLPPMTADDVALTDEQGHGFAPDEVWWLWVVEPGACEQQCQHALRQLRQLHVLLNKDAVRIRRAFLTSADRLAVSAWLHEQYPQLVRLTGSLSKLSRGVYIVDPIGNLVLWYPLIDAGSPVLDDLKRLLKVSQIG